MNGWDKYSRIFGRFVRAVQKAQGVSKADRQPMVEPAVETVMVMPAVSQSARELINEGLRQRERHGTQAALDLFERAAQLEPNSHLPFFMLGNASTELGDLDAAVAYYERARDLQPNNHVIHYNLGLSHFWRGYIELAIDELGAARRLNPTYLPAQSTYIMALHNSDRVDPEEIATAIREWAAGFAQQHTAAARPLPMGVSAAQMLRVGFISGDFRTHSVAHFFEPIASARKHAALEYIFYSSSRHQDAVTERLRACANSWRDAWLLDDDALIRQIRADRIDVLVDLAGHTEFNRLAVFARRAAPVQVSYLGYPNSTGLSTMDFRITDGVTDPQPLAESWHSETLLRMPVSQWCFRPFGDLAAPGPLPAREAGFVTFGSFNNLTKASNTLLRCWVQILVNVPMSRLRLTRVRSPQRAAEIVAMFEQSGVAAERIQCVPYRNDAPHGLQFAGVDVALDHYPYNGVTTTCESLYVGVPVISLHGRNSVSRSGLSILSGIGLPELVASTPEEYVEIAVGLAKDLTRLEQLRLSLRTRCENSPLRDEARFAVNFEELLRSAWRQYLARPR